MVTTTEDQDVDPQAGQSLVIAATPARDFEAEVMVKELGLDLEEEQLEE